MLLFGDLITMVRFRSYYHMQTHHLPVHALVWQLAFSASLLKKKQNKNKVDIQVSLDI